jgi:hypothetical protein
MKKHVLNCTRRVDGKYCVIIADTCGGKNMRQVISEKAVRAGSDVEVRDGKVVQ